MSINILQINRYDVNGKKRSLNLRFCNGEILPKEALKWARAIAREWGEINAQAKVKAEGLPGPVWWFSCSGHGGYIMVAPETRVPPVLRRFACDGVGVQTSEWVQRYGERYSYTTVYRFEEDCDWAVFVAVFPQVAKWEIISQRRWPVRVQRDAGEDAAVAALIDDAKQSVRRWQAPEVVAALLE